ncbi:MAG: hypothetical protein R2861_06330 [Desulfobacterales bacterium]
MILKPGAVSGVSGMVQAINRLRQQGVKTVMSSAYNTGIGIAALAGWQVFRKALRPWAGYPEIFSSRPVFSGAVHR